MEIYRRIGDRIRHARLGVGMTQPALAELLGVSKGIISRWETGLARPSLDRLEPLATRLGMTLEQMLGFAAAPDVGAYQPRSLPVWRLTQTTVPVLTPDTAIGHVVVGEQEAQDVQGALQIADSAFAPYLLPGDVVGVRLPGRPKVGDVVLVRVGNQQQLRRFGGRRGGMLLLPFEIGPAPQAVRDAQVIGIYRWLRRPGQVLPL